MIHKDMLIADVLMKDRGVVPILFQHGLHCVGCVMASNETIAEACEVHGMDADALIADLNAYFEGTDSQN